ncbi:MAG: glycosyltransferase [Candidatus Aureabacteria bacterium]|nr:glycosyltransferase [Candidatus Auribacterota bacterium]
MSNVLFISYAFPPFDFPETIQAARYAQNLKNYGWSPSVLTASESRAQVSKDDSLLKLISEEINITRSFSLEPSPFLSKIFYHVFSEILHLPDSKIGWYPFACKKAMYMMEKVSFDLIYSRACYFTSHLTALKIKEKTGLPWVAHFSDPWADNPYHDYGKLAGFINRRMEKAVIENVDAVVFVTEETRQLVMKKYPSEWLGKAHVIPNAYDAYLISQREKRKNKKLTFTYTGSFYRGIRTPLALFKAVQFLIKENPDLHKHITIQIVGKLDDEYKKVIAELKIDNIIDVVGKISYLKSLDYIVNANVLLLIDAFADKESVFLPSKLIEYIAAENPILGITPEKGASAELIRKTGGVVVATEDIEGIAKGILFYYKKYKKNKLQNCFLKHADIKPYDIVFTAKKLVKLFNQILTQRK